MSYLNLTKHLIERIITKQNFILDQKILRCTENDDILNS